MFFEQINNTDKLLPRQIKNREKNQFTKKRDGSRAITTDFLGEKRHYKRIQ